MMNASFASIDSRLFRWLLSIFALGSLSAFVPVNTALQYTGAIFATGFAVLLCVYFGWLLLSKLQCSLVELCVVIAMLGNVEGLLLTTPGVASFGWSIWALAALCAGWIFGGAVKAAVQARILGEVDVLPRVFLLLLNWFVLAAPAMLLAGFLLHYGRLVGDGAIVSNNMAAMGPLLIAIGGVGTVLLIGLEFKISRAARRILLQRRY